LIRIGFDATAAAWQGAGIGRAARSLLLAMLRRRDPDIEWVVFYLGQRIARRFEETLADHGVIPSLIPVSPRLGFFLWQRLRAPIPVELFTGRLDLLHSPDFVLPFSFARRRVLTIHDLTYLSHPHTAEPRLRERLDRAVRRSIRAADRIHCVSAHTAAAVGDLLGFDADRIDVIYNGLDLEVAAPPTADAVERIDELGLPDQFVLSVGTLQPRKNMLRTVQAVAELRARGQEVGLVHVGATGWISDRDLANMDRIGREFLVRLGAVDDGLLRALYARARALAAVSEAEGFLLPIIEAMAHSVPVVTGDASCMPEIAGGAALLADPLDVEAIADALERALEPGADRERRLAAGLVRAGEFDWDRAARETLASYRNALN
jgi:glycosyltransferase involved in cell wall biosynthesis